MSSTILLAEIIILGIIGYGPVVVKILTFLAIILFGIVGTKILIDILVNYKNQKNNKEIPYEDSYFGNLEQMEETTNPIITQLLIIAIIIMIIGFVIEYLI